MPSPRDSAQVDVIRSAPYLGNPVAVILDGDDLDDRAMHVFRRSSRSGEAVI